MGDKKMAYFKAYENANSAFKSILIRCAKCQIFGI